eukprot:761813-Hanusia_phi.AAC.7
MPKSISAEVITPFLVDCLADDNQNAALQEKLQVVERVMMIALFAPRLVLTRTWKELTQVRRRETILHAKVSKHAGAACLASDNVAQLKSLVLGMRSENDINFVNFNQLDSHGDNDLTGSVSMQAH